MKLRELLKFDDIAIQCHDAPDADAVASGFGIYKYLCANGRSPLLFYSGNKKISKANMLTMVEMLGIPIRYIEALKKKPELLVTVDCCHGESNVRDFDADNFAVIDHHLCKGVLPELSEVRSNYGSCSSLIAKLLADENIDINADIKLATALYYGLYMDTNGFAEIGHPADKDLMDFAEYDRPIIRILQNSNLSSGEMLIAGEALKGCEYLDEYRTALVRTKPCDPNLLGFISDLILQVDSVDSCVVFCRNASGYKLSVRSCTSTINAADFAGFIAENVGNGGGHAGKAGGFIEGRALPDVEIGEYIRGRMISYHRDTDILYAGKDHADLSEMEKYIKKDIVLGYVPSTEIVPEGGEIFIRMLESDATVISGKGIYLMVGVSGEVYPIKKEVFGKRYKPTDELPDTDYEYTPSVIDREVNTSRPITPYIRGCRASEDSFIMAKRLTRYTKVFTEWNRERYMYGAPGDHLAVRAGGDTDIYIIKHDIFLKTYRRDDGE